MKEGAGSKLIWVRWWTGFYDNNHLVKSSMEDTLRAAGITDVYCTGLAYDYCVGSTGTQLPSQQCTRHFAHSPFLCV